jgi:hypothetical protein
VKQIDLLEKLRRFRTVCHHLKRRFTNVLKRRRHKIMVLSEYWTAIAETCYFLKQFKKKAMVEGYRGHKFIKITRDIQLKVIRKHLQERDRLYITQKKAFLIRIQQLSDVRLRLTSKMLVQLQEFAAMKKSASGEITKLQQQVYEHFINELSKGGPDAAKKNIIVISHLKRQIALL